MCSRTRRGTHAGGFLVQTESEGFETTFYVVRPRFRCPISRSGIKFTTRAAAVSGEHGDRLVLCKLFDKGERTASQYTGGITIAYTDRVTYAARLVLRKFWNRSHKALLQRSPVCILRFLLLFLLCRALWFPRYDLPAAISTVLSIASSPVTVVWIYTDSVYVGFFCQSCTPLLDNALQTNLRLLHCLTSCKEMYIDCVDTSWMFHSSCLMLK